MEKKKMSLMTCIFMGMGSIIGAGIFAVTPVGIRMVGYGIVWGFILAAVFLFLKTIPEIILSSSLPATGGAYMHLSRLVHPGLGALQAFNQLVTGTMKVATLSLTFSTYFAILFPSINPILIAVVIIVLFTVISLFGVRVSGWVQNISVLILLVALGVYVFGGFPNITVSPQDIIVPTIELTRMWAAMGMLHGSLIGANALMYAADEIENPRRNIPIAFFVSTLLCAVIYAFISFVTVGVGGIENIPDLAHVAGQFLNPAMLTFFITGGALLAVVTSINAVILMFSRSHFAAARDGLFPSIISKINKHGAPSASIWLNSIIAIICIVAGFNLDDVVKITSVPGLLLSPIMYLGIFVLPKKYPNAYKSCFIKTPHWANCIIVVVAAALCYLLGGSVLKNMEMKNWIAMVVFYGAAAIYTFVRIKWLKKNKNIDLFENMRKTYEPWEELEKGLSGKI